MYSKTHFKPTLTVSSTKYILVKFIFAALICTSKANTEENKVKLVPLTAQKVYQLLGRSRNLHVIPEGRVASQGIAAVTGFTLGLMKALGAVFLYDVITANITEVATNQTVNTPLYSTQEICFGSRADKSLKAAEAVKRPQRLKVPRPKHSKNIADPSILTLSAPASQTSRPTAAITVTGSFDELNLKAVSNMKTTSSATASTDNDHSITCIVIQKPKLK